MGRAHLFVTFLLVIFVGNTYVVSVLAQEEDIRTQYYKECIYSWECSTGCCTKGFCAPRNESCAQDSHPCLSEPFDCPEGATCGLSSVNCFRAPCPPVPMCIGPIFPNQCTNVTCGPGSHCELNKQAPVPKNCANPSLCPPRAVCVKDSSCQKSSCPSGSTCMLSGKQRICVASCDRFPCPKGSYCILQIAECRVSRCDLKPKCIPSPARGKNT